MLTSVRPWTSIVIEFGVRYLKTKPKLRAAETNADSSGLCAWYSSLEKKINSVATVIDCNRHYFMAKFTCHPCNLASLYGIMRANGKSCVHALRQLELHPPKSNRTTWIRARIPDWMRSRWGLNSIANINFVIYWHSVLWLISFFVKKSHKLYENKNKNKSIFKAKSNQVKCAVQTCCVKSRVKINEHI